MRPTASRSPTACADYYALVNERDGGINGVKIAYEECDTGYATDRGVECYERLKGKGADRRGLRLPLQHRHHLRAHREGAGRQDPDHLDGLRPLRERATAACSSGTSRCSAPTGRPPTSSCSTSPRRKAASTSSRARRSCWSITTRPTARSRSRCSSSAPRCTASSSRPCRSPIPASSRRRPGCRSARTGPTTSCCGAGAS